ncbi:hypothetical protein [Haloarchaeobius sp. HME9146]|uniref:hypothetical protein n=1 Tax=Haloarchaeobius sp. HME9146 TaxID=2978732 RepID=UPI0021BF8588|nr:hypothetical protein [Haloarchaeobius sp. HME9146]MCT9095598.1 hypothetical protein [Haloarchaeobius sp. HME9146]
MATIVYQGADEMVTEHVDDEDLNYREDHWQIHQGNDNYVYVPRERVYTVTMTDPHSILDEGR